MVKNYEAAITPNVTVVGKCGTKWNVNMNGAQIDSLFNQHLGLRDC